MNGLVFFSLQWTVAGLPLASWEVPMWLGHFCSAKGQREFDFTLAFVASHEAYRRMAVLYYATGREPHQTGEPRGLLPSGGSFAAKPHVHRAAPRPKGAVWGAGGHPLP